jgi:hypothetical protein
MVGVFLADIFDGKVVNYQAKEMGRLSWRYRPGVFTVGKYPCCARCFLSLTLAMIPA